MHAVLFVGGEDALLYSLKIYFWLFLLLDFLVLGLMFNRKNGNNKNVFELIFNRNKKQNTVNNEPVNQVNVNQEQKLPKKSSLKRKTVRFKNYESDR